MFRDLNSWTVSNSDRPAGRHIIISSSPSFPDLFSSLPPSLTKHHYSLFYTVYVRAEENILERVCPGDSVVYTCSHLNFRLLQNQIDQVQISLSVTYPGSQAIGIVYNRDDRIDISRELGMNTFSTLVTRTQTFVQFSVMLTVPPSSVIAGTTVNCSLIHPPPNDEASRVRSHIVTVDIPATEGTHNAS